MAGAVAVAAVMEDFESQPCKKLRKDADAPPVKTITNYFMPKPVEKPFSPPRSNNIMDYFKKTPPAQETKSCSQVTKENSSQPSEQAGSCEIPAKPLRAQGLKRTRRTKETKKSKEEDAQVATDDVILIENPKETSAKESAIVTKSSDASTLLDESGHDVSSDMRKNATEANSNVIKESVESVEKNQNKKKDCWNSALSAPTDEKGKNKKSSLRRNQKAKGGGEEPKQCEANAEECDAKSEAGGDKTSMQNISTVTISFADFVHDESQKQDEANAVSSSAVTETSDETTICDDKSESAVVPLQVSPQTLTVQAEVHPISPDHDVVKAAKDLKVASIFSKNKRSMSKEDKISPVLSPEVKSNVLPDHKRKSNVVILEEDLELDVVESSINPKSTEAERKQFMNAFKQPNLDGFKSKTSKGQSKQNQVQEKVPEAVDKEHEDTSLENKPVTSSEQTEEQKNSAGEKKPVRKAGKKRQAKIDEDAPVAAPKDPTKEMDDEKESSPADDDSCKQNVRQLRRSTRDLSHKQPANELHTNTTSQKVRQKSKPKDDVTQNTPTLASTPKVHRSKRGIYRAEMLCPPDMKGSPIRMKITRVFPSSATKAGDFEISSPLSKQGINAYKKRKQAKKLVEKAKALQQNKKDTTKKETLRRSSRSKESSVNYCDDEDSVVFLEECKSTPVTTQESVKRQKKLRSLNEVLGKGASQGKACKTPAASKLAPLFVEKKTQRPPGVISIFDDSSREASETSQDDEQFRAKREFLKSGLPESFKKQIAKTAASREAYSQACASFQTVVHVQQRAADCSVWNLQWPSNPFLVCLKEYDLPSVSLMSLERSLGYTTVPTKKTHSQRVSCCQKEISESVRQHLLEKIKISNPSFPYQRFFTRFLKRREDYKLQASAPEPEGQSNTPCPTESSDGIGRKRKRVDEGEASGKVGKKPKSSHTDDEVIVIDEPSENSNAQASHDVTEPVPPGRSRRGRLQRQKQKEAAKPAKVTSPVRNQTSRSVSPEAAGTEDGIKEDVLWTEKYQPQHSSDVIGNMDSIRKLHSWLKEWKLRADREEKRKQQEKQQEDDANESWLMSEGIEEMEDLLCNTLLITGPTGVGKTAAVYACAQELGFKVFEVNSSSQRSGRHILSQLKEATQSHQVDIQGVNTQKPSYFSNYSSTSTTTKPGNSPRKVNSPRRVVSSPRKPPQSPRSNPSRRGLAPTSLASFFKAGGRPAGKEANNKDKKAQPACLKKETLKKGNEGSSEIQANTKISGEDQGKRTATSLILFEEVDIIFDDDTGFLAAIKTFMTTTKRPVILITSDPSFGATFDGYFEEIHFKVPSGADVSSYLQLLCLAENMRTDARDVRSLLDWNKCDIRQSLLHLQFWACSGGSEQVQKPLSTSDVKCKEKSDVPQSVKAEDPCVDGLPPCYSVCTERVLGIQNLETENVEEMLRKNESSIQESIKCWDLLSEVHSRGVDLLYSNMESLLPLPTLPLLPSTFRSQPAPNTQPQPKHVSLAVSLDVEEPSDDCSPMKVSSRMKGRKKLGSNKDVFHSDSDSEDEFLTLPKPSKAPTQRTKIEPADQSVSHVSEGAPVKPKRVVLSESQRKKSEPVLQCLSSLAEYMDHMSLLDSSLHRQSLQTEGSCRPQDFGWTGAEVKNGMTDDVRLGCENQMNGVSGQEIHAVLGDLSFRRCRAAVCEAWDRSQQLEEEIRKDAEVELSLPVAPHRQGFCLAQTTPCEPRVIERRSEVMRSVLSSRSAGTLGNRTAVSLDYLPSLRAICRSEKLKEQGKIKRRFLHYLDGIHFTLPKSTIEFLASEFP